MLDGDQNLTSKSCMFTTSGRSPTKWCVIICACLTVLPPTQCWGANYRHAQTLAKAGEGIFRVQNHKSKHFFLAECKISFHRHFLSVFLSFLFALSCSSDIAAVKAAWGTTHVLRLVFRSPRISTHAFIVIKWSSSLRLNYHLRRMGRVEAMDGKVSSLLLPHIKPGIRNDGLFNWLTVTG